METNRIRWDGAGKRIRYKKTVHCTSEQTARKELALFVANIDRGNLSTSGKMTLIEYFSYWEEHYAIPHHKKKTIAYNRNLFKRISEAMGQLRIDKIKPKHLLNFYKNLAEPVIRQDPNTVKRKIVTNIDKPLKDTLSPNTIRKYHVLLHTLLGQAAQWQLIPYNPADKVEAPKAKKTIKKNI